MQRFAADDGEGVVQLKSHFTSLVKDADVKTPIESLSDGAKPFFEEAELKESYNFHLGGVVTPDQYGDGFERARSATAVIERDSYGRNGDRDNTVIGPYGHFGWMERSILGRPNHGNIFDGGHLVERSLMEDADADIHGNLAPQEGKQFNQDLMRGWEHIPEEYQRYMDFTYTMALEYTDLQYSRTGQELIDAGVVPAGLLTALDAIGKGDAFRTKVFQFDRWIPYKWTGLIDAGAGKAFPTKSFPKGAHYQRLQPTVADARQRVLGPDPIGPLMAPPLLRTRSGEVAGAIDGLAVAAGGATFFVGGGQQIGAEMFTGLPHPMAEQAAGLRGGIVPTPLPVFGGAVSAVADTFSLKRLRDRLALVKTKKVLGGGNLADATVDSAAKEIPEYRVLRRRVTNVEGAKFVRAFRRELEENGDFALTKAAFQGLANESFGASGKSFVQELVYDPKCILGDPPPMPDVVASEPDDEEEDFAVDAMSAVATMSGSGASAASAPPLGVAPFGFGSFAPPPMLAPAFGPPSFGPPSFGPPSFGPSSVGWLAAAPSAPLSSAYPVVSAASAMDADVGDILAEDEDDGGTMMDTTSAVVPED